MNTESIQEPGNNCMMKSVEGGIHQTIFVQGL